MNHDALIKFFHTLVSEGRAPVEGLGRERLASVGIPIEGDMAVLADEVELLDRNEILQQLDADARRWLRSIDIKPATGSTNSDLMQLKEPCIDGRVILAETQLSGRGRRGRTWISPFARNIALTLGIEVQRSGQDIGGLSLVVGYGVLEALEGAGVTDLALKWPNDLLYQGRKLCGVLIEMHHSRGSPQAVVGIGINHSGAQLVRAKVDRSLAELVEAEHPPSRNETVAAVISAVHRQVMRFNTEGFDRLRDAWNAKHYFAGRQVRIEGAGKAIIGKVLGVSAFGELHIATPFGEEFLSGGEISMHEHPFK